MIKEKRKKTDAFVKMINAEHNYNLLIEHKAKEYRTILQLPSISIADLLARLLELKHDKLYNQLKTMLDYKDNYETK